jgi:nitroreductase
MTQLIQDLNWRYAVKKYDSTKKISEEDFNLIKEVLRLTPTAYGFQAMKYLIIENPEIRQKLLSKSYNQHQVVDASHLIVLCAYNTVAEIHIEDHIQRTARTRNITSINLAGSKANMLSTFSKWTVEKTKEWTAKQCYISLGMLMQTCAQLRVDATPMEGFDPQGYDEVLSLKEQNLHAVLVCPIGYRHEEDGYGKLSKVRKTIPELFEEI